jgi:hypothetical protein
VPLPPTDILRLKASKTTKKADFDLSLSAVMPDVIARRRANKKAEHLMLLAGPFKRPVSYRQLHDRFVAARAAAAVKAEEGDDRELAAAIRALWLRDCRKYAADLAACARAANSNGRPHHPSGRVGIVDDDRFAQHCVCRGARYRLAVERVRGVEPIVQDGGFVAAAAREEPFQRTARHACQIGDEPLGHRQHATEHVTAVSHGAQQLPQLAPFAKLPAQDPQVDRREEGAHLSRGARMSCKPMLGRMVRPFTASAWPLKALEAPSSIDRRTIGPALWKLIVRDSNSLPSDNDRS